MSGSKPIRILLFANLAVEGPDGCLTRFRTQKTASLLAYLAFHGERAHPREILTELFWPDATEEAARNSLSTALSSLRQQFHVVAPAVPQLLLADRNLVRLAPECFTTDVREFELLLKRARGAGTVLDRIELLCKALDLYRGELLRGMYDDWVFLEQTRLSGLYEAAIAEICTLLDAQGTPKEAVPYACQAVALDPLSQAARCRLMRLHARVGEPVLALAHYQELSRLLRRELDEAPDAATRELAEAIRTGALNGARAEPGAGTIPVVPRQISPAAAHPDPDEPVGGAVPLNSGFYIQRGADAEFAGAIARQDSILLVKGARQTGKTSLLARGLQQARSSGARVVLTDLQTLPASQFAALDSIYRALAETLADQLELPRDPTAVWEPQRGASLNLRRFLLREVFPSLQGPLVWSLDEVDRLFTCPFYGDVFGLFRSWHNERALNPEGPWAQLTLALAYATEAHLFITDLNQSPFNVGTRIELGDFDAEQVAELNRRHGSPLRDQAELATFVALVGGQPFLVRRGLYELAHRRVTLKTLEAVADQQGQPFTDHLQRMFAALTRDRRLAEVMRNVLQGAPCPDEGTYYRLRSAGLILGETPASVRPRCGLYRRYLERHLAGYLAKPVEAAPAAPHSTAPDPPAGS